ncbi:MAG: cysteine synthase, partial [Candidatus Xenobia bacterium]
AAFPDRILPVPTEPSYEWARRLAARGLLVGMSAGAAMWGAVEVARELREGVVVTLFPDGGDRYLSTGLFDAEN